MSGLLAPITIALCLATDATPLSQSAEAEGVRVTVSAPASTMEVGATIPVTLTVEAPAGVPFTLPAVEHAVGPFDVRDVQRLAGPTGDARSAALRLDLTTYESGAVELPSLTCTYRGADGEWHDLATPAATVEVTTLLSGEFDPKAFRDIKDAVEISVPWAWWWWLVAGAGTFGGAAIAWRLMRRPVMPPEQPLPPQAWAMRELDSLEHDGLVARGAFHPYWVRLSSVVREYIERRFEVSAPEQTTAEFLRAVRNHPGFDEGQRTTLATFLRAADRVKFAAETPVSGECERGMSIARTFVETTAPADEPAPEEVHA